MKLQRTSHLASKTLLMVTALVLVMTASFFAYFIIHIRHTLDAAARDEGLALSRSISGACKDGIWLRDPGRLDASFAAIEEHPGLVFVAAYGADKTLISFSSNLIATSPPLSPESVRRALGGRPLRGEQLRVGELAVDDFYAPVFAPFTVSEDNAAADRRGQVTGFVRVGLSRTKISTAKSRLIIFSLSAAGIFMAASILAASFLTRRITRPLAQLEEMTRQISDGNLDVDLPITSRDEVGTLSSSFNAMAQALRRTTVSKSYVDNVVASMNDALIVISPGHMIATTNLATQTLLGMEAAALEGRPVDQIFTQPPIDAEGWERLRDGETLQAIGASLRTSKGTHVSVSLSVSPMFDRQWRFGGAVAVARDMSAFERLLAQLKTHADKLERNRTVLTSMLEDNERARAAAEAERLKAQTALDSMAEGVILFDAAGAPAMLNPAAHRMLCLDSAASPDVNTLSAILGIDLAPLLADADDAAGQRLLHDLVLGRTPQHTIRVEGTPVRHKETRVGSMLVLRDITRERQLDQAKHELITNVSHELRTPLAAISNIVSNVLVGVTGPIGSKLRSHLEIARVNTKRLANIIDNLIEVANLDAGRVSIRRETIDFIATVQEGVRAVMPEVEQKLITLNTNLPAAPLTVYCDPLAIGQVIRNLLINAVRYTPQGGVVSLSVERFDSTVQVSVTDTGVGIPPEDQISIFEHFHQIGRTYGPGEKGLGLGLSISRQLVEMHGGSIGMTSTPREGSCFTFRIPSPEGEALILAALDDFLRELPHTGLLPSLWVLVPTPRHLSPEANATFLELTESALRNVSGDLRHIVAHGAGGHEVLAILLLKTAEDTEQIADRLEAALCRPRPDGESQPPGFGVAMAHGVCTNPKERPAALLDMVRKKLTR